MASPLLGSVLSAIRGVFRRRDTDASPDSLSALVNGSPAFLFQINHNAQLGRHAVASAALAGRAPGTILLRETSAVWTPTDGGITSVCHHCAAELDSAGSRRTSCTGCDGQTHYCSAKCRDAHAPLHSPVCRLHANAPALAARHHCPQSLVLALLALIARRCRSLSQPAVHSPAQARIPADPLTFEADPTAFAQMHGDPQTIDAAARRCLRTLADSLCDGLPEEQRPPFDLFLKWTAQINANSHGLQRAHKTQEDFGLGLFPLSSLFNHSCIPNCTYTNEGAQMVLRLLRTVDEGEELCVNYVELYAARDERRAELKAGKRFECRCPRCTHSPRNAAETRLLQSELFVSGVLCDQTPGCTGLLRECNVHTDRVGDRSAQWACTACNARCTYGSIADTHLTPLRNSLQSATTLYSEGLTIASAPRIRAAFEAVLKEALVRLPPSHAIVFHCHLPLINCCSTLGDYDAMATHARAVVALADATLPRHLPVANYLAALAKALELSANMRPPLPHALRRQHATEACAAWERALEICEVCLGAKHPQTARTRAQLLKAQAAAKSL